MLALAEGFDNLLRLADKYVLSTGNGSIGISSGASRAASGQGIFVNVTNNTSSASCRAQQTITTLSGSHIYVNAAFFVNSFGAVSTVNLCYALDSAGGVQFSIWLTALGVLQVWRGRQTALLGSCTINTLAYNSFQMDIVLASGATGSLNLYLNGSNTPAISVSGLVTAGTANLNVGVWGWGEQLGGAPAGNTYLASMDDTLVYDNSGSSFNTLLTDLQVKGELATGDGSPQQYATNTTAWPANTAVPVGTTILDSNGNLQRVTSISGTGTTGAAAPTWNVTVGGTTTDHAGSNQVIWTNIGPVAHYKLINEPSPDSDYSYLSDSTPGDQELFTFPSVAAGTVIYGVVVDPFARRDDVAARVIRAIAKSGASVGDNGFDFGLASTYAFPTQPMAIFNDPATGLPFTVTGFNGAQFGVKTIS